MLGAKRGLVVACSCLVAATSVQCGGAEDRSKRADSTLVIHLADGDERALGPIGLQWFYVFLGLASDPDFTGDYEPRLMESWEHTRDYTDWTLHLRDDVLWGDGVPVTAKDVKFSLELWTDTAVAYEYRFHEDIEVLDSRTLQITFTEPVSATVFVYNWLPVLPRHLLDTLNLQEIYTWPFWIQPVGNGPYRYAKHIPQTMTELEANPDYYGEPPRIPTVVLQYGGNGFTELVSGSVDIASQITPLEAVQLDADPRFEIYHMVGSNFMGIAWNHRNPLFDDAAIRRALTMSIDRRGLHQVLYYPDDIHISDVPTTRRHFANGSVPEPLPFDPDRAAQLFDSAGWVDGNNDGIREKDGQDFRFTLSVSPETEAQGIYIQEQLRRVGVRMEVSTFERSTLRERARAHDFDATIAEYNFVEQYRDFPTTGYVNPEVSRLASTLWYTMDQEKSDEYLREIWQIVATDVPITYLHPKMSYSAAHRRVKGLQSNRFLADIVEDLWIEDE